MSTWNQAAAYTALGVRMAQLEVPLLIGVPRAVHQPPVGYLTSTVVEVLPSGLVTRLRPTLTLVVDFKDQEAAEFEIVVLVDHVAAGIMDAPLEDVCRARIETVTYDWRTVGGIDYRVADLSMVLSQL